MKYLLDERPLIVQPSLVKLLGSIERAVVLQQIHWLLQQPHSGEIDDNGDKWVWGTLQQWCDDYFQMWSPHTLRKHLRWLRENGYLVVEKKSRNGWDKTNQYRVNYAMFEGDIEGSEERPDVVSSKRPDVVSSKRPDVVASYKEQKLQQKLQQKGLVSSNPINGIADKPESPSRKPRKRSNKVPLPDDFGISDAVRDWANRNGFDHLEDHLEYFRDAAMAKGYKYVDWDAAFKNAIRSDWAGLRNQKQQQCSREVFHDWIRAAV